MANTKDVYVLKSSRAPWRRAGFVFSSRGMEITVDVDSLSPDQLKRLKGDPAITVTKTTVEDLDADAKAAADAAAKAKADADAKAAADAAAKAQADAAAKAQADAAKAAADAAAKAGAKS